jgi:CubicO group peptidase (beta-lactamase class C family)
LKATDKIVLSSIKQLIQEALTDQVFPGGVLLASKQDTLMVQETFGKTDYDNEVSVSLDTIYDLASLTKPLATTLAVMHLIKTRGLQLEQRLGDLLPVCTGTDKADITVAHLLAHQAGLPDYRPYWKKLAGTTASQRDADLKKRLLQEPLEYPTGRRTVYSDLGFMFLRWVVEQVSGVDMSQLVAKEIYRPLDIKELFFPDDMELAADRVAPTEVCAWRRKLVQGVVHDENAYAVGGIDGHAGLFGTAPAVHDLLWKMLCAYTGNSYKNVLPQNLVQTFFNFGQGSERALGFDRPTQPGSSSGRYFSENSVGHLGFTGSSLWMDLEKNVIVVLLTNRIHPTRDNDNIKTFRPRIHDAIMESLL